ncbi:MAG: RING finger protein [Planctomycetota bacterium]
MEKPPATLPPQPAPERRSDVKVVGSLARCPYCHEDVDQENAWVACAECLARHHTECWDEAGRCASCSASERLTREGSGGGGASRYPRLRQATTVERPGKHRLFGQPLRTAFKTSFEGELNAPGEAPWLEAEMRRVFRTKGVLNTSPTEVSWRPTQEQNCRMLSAKIAAKGGQTTLEVEEAFGPLLGLLGGLGLGGGFGLLVPLFAFLCEALGFEAQGWVVLGVMAFLSTILVPLLLVFYRRIVSRRREQLQRFSERLARRLTAPPPQRRSASKPAPHKP